MYECDTLSDWTVWGFMVVKGRETRMSGESSERARTVKGRSETD